MLRHFVNPRQDKWDTLLPILEFAGNHPRMPSDVMLPEKIPWPTSICRTWIGPCRMQGSAWRLLSRGRSVMLMSTDLTCHSTWVTTPITSNNKRPTPLMPSQLLLDFLTPTGYQISHTHMPYWQTAAPLQRSALTTHPSALTIRHSALSTHLETTHTHLSSNRIHPASPHPRPPHNSQPPRVGFLINLLLLII